MIVVVGATVSLAQDSPVTNHLAGSTSPYLLQHAHNPVDWYPWGPEAIELARRLDKPIFLSVGYSTCYWCHVMEREVFENEAIAKLMNDSFVCIKVDREERPDLDEIYMAATQLLGRHGGWPNSVFLTPQLKPFFAGTYFGPEDQPGRPGFPTVLLQLREAWTTQRARVEEVAAKVSEAIDATIGGEADSTGSGAGTGTGGAAVAGELGPAIVNRTIQDLGTAFDPLDGGFGAAPKFPSDFYYSFLLDAGGERGRMITTTTLDAMAAGGIHDHVGGGFHRYSVDGQWHVPHFEKMLYNQAMLLGAFVDAFAVSADSRYADVAHGIIRFVGERFTGSDGRFYSALDAETDAVEGAYFVWTREEIVSVLGEREGSALLEIYRIVPVPEFPGHLHPDGGALVRKDRIAPVSEEERAMLGRLAAVRAVRKLPRLDDKSIAAWNGMMIDAEAHAGTVLGDLAAINAARRAADFVLLRMVRPDGTLMRTVRGDSQGSHDGFLEDYAWVVRGLLALAKAEGSGDGSSASRERWMSNAIRLQAKADELFWDGVRGGYFGAETSADLIARSRERGDGATPSGNSVMAHNLVDLARATGDIRYRDRCDDLLRAFAPTLTRMPHSAVHLVHALHRRLADGPIVAALPRVTVKYEPVKAIVASTGSGPHPAAVSVAVTVATGWHINANPASAKDLVPTTVDLSCDDPAVTVIGVDAPEVVEIPSKLPEAPIIRGYTGKALFVIRVAIARALVTGESIPLRIVVRSQACSDDGVCERPSSVTVHGAIEVQPSP